MPADQPRFQPLYEQIRQRIVERIASGEWQADAMLPSEWELAAEFAVSQGTARKALNDLTRDGWLYRRQGRGTFVAPGESEWGEGKLVSPGHFAELADPMQPELLSVARVPSGEDVARALQLRRGAMLHHVRQVWRQRGVTLAVDEILLPVERFADLDSRRLRLAGGGLYALLERQYAVRIRPLHVQYRRPGRPDAAGRRTRRTAAVDGAARRDGGRRAGRVATASVALCPVVVADAYMIVFALRHSGVV